MVNIILLFFNEKVIKKIVLVIFSKNPNIPESDFRKKIKAIFLESIELQQDSESIIRL